MDMKAPVVVSRVLGKVRNGIEICAIWLAGRTVRCGDNDNQKLAWV
jgi:hypothetical protein